MFIFPDDDLALGVALFTALARVQTVEAARLQISLTSPGLAAPCFESSSQVANPHYSFRAAAKSKEAHLFIPRLSKL